MVNARAPSGASGRRTAAAAAAAASKSAAVDAPARGGASAAPARRLWYLHGKAYDFSAFVERHPGGREAIMLARGVDDCTELFESYHTHLPGADLLRKYEVRDAAVARDAAEHHRLSDARFSFADDGFYRTLKRRAAAHFKASGAAHTKAGPLSVAAFFATLAGIAATYWLTFGAPATTSLGATVVAAVVYGVLRALLIVRDSHASSHYALFVSPRANQWAYRITMSLSGTTPAQWSAKHVVAHHVDTNIAPHDDDSMHPIKRMLVPHQRYAYHRFQHVYMWAFYCFTTAMWTVSNFVKLAIGYHLEGVTRIAHHTAADVAETWGVIGFHIAHRFVLPYVIAYAAGTSLLRTAAIYALSEAACSLWFSLQFVVNHEVIEAVAHADAADRELKQQQKPQGKQAPTHGDWGAWQVVTSHDYAPRSWFALHASGGLNTQIEHHLFPSVHFSHYRALGEITRRTCAEFGIDYNQSSSFTEALSRHQEALYVLGRHDELPEKHRLRASGKKQQ